MARAVHDSEAVAAFQDGETRLVYARHKDRPAGPPYYLADGSARDPALRVWAKEHLECLMPECSERALTVVNRSQYSGRRDGFAHRPGAGRHAAEGLFHQQAKALVRAWVWNAYPLAKVATEVQTANAERVADVMVTWPTGLQTAVEIQYAPLSIDAWRRRDDSYRRGGITAVWLLGHYGPHMKVPAAVPGQRHQGEVRLSLLQRTLADRQGAAPALLWVNPLERTIATPWTTQTLAGHAEPFATFCRSDTEHAFLSIDKLDACQLDPDFGIVTPTMERLAQSQQRFEAARDIVRAQEARAEQARRAAAAAATRQRLGRYRQQRDPEWDEDTPLGPSRRSKAEETPCRGCGGPLDEVLVGAEYHLLCSPRI